MRSPEASCTASSSPLPSEEPQVVHLVAFTTKHSERLQRCWLQWVSHMSASDTTPQLSYRLQLRSQDPGNVSTGWLSKRAKVATATRPAGSFQTAAWYAAVNAKMAAWRDLLIELHAAGRENDLVIISDLDVAPLRPYSSLLPCRSSHEITFMQEPKGHASSFGPHLVNTGFSLIRNTEQVRAFFANVCSRFKRFPKLHDQDIVNALLVSHVGHPRSRAHGLPAPRGRPVLDWGVFPTSHVTGELEDVNANTIAFHAIDAHNATHKLAKFAAVFGRSGTTLPMCT